MNLDKYPLWIEMNCVCIENKIGGKVTGCWGRIVGCEFLHFYPRDLINRKGTSGEKCHPFTRKVKDRGGRGGKRKGKTVVLNG